MRKQVAYEHTWTPHHDTTLSMCKIHHEDASWTLVFYNKRKLFY